MKVGEMLAMLWQSQQGETDKWRDMGLGRIDEPEAPRLEALRRDFIRLRIDAEPVRAHL